MSQPVVEKIIRGETFDLEIRFVGENFSGATATITADSGIDTTQTQVTTPSIDTVKILDYATAFWQVGTHRLRIWVQFAGSPGLKEMPIEIRVSVEPEIGFDPLYSTLIIDGGQPGTVFDEPDSPFDGGEV